MRSPRTPGTGIAGALNSLGGDGVHSAEAGPDMRRHYSLALHLDHEVGAFLFRSRHVRIERLTRLADALRVSVTL